MFAIYVRSSQKIGCEQRTYTKMFAIRNDFLNANNALRTFTTLVFIDLLFIIGFSVFSFWFRQKFIVLFQFSPPIVFKVIFLNSNITLTYFLFPLYQKLSLLIKVVFIGGQAIITVIYRLHINFEIQFDQYTFCFYILKLLYHRLYILLIIITL